MSRPAPTPVMRQYFAAKEAHPGALLFFRMGDFYELFYDDAVVAARALDLTLTSRNKGAEDEVPMAGVPHHAASSYIQKLLDQGFQVAICEQMADPASVKGIVPREVVRVVMPGIAYDDSGLDARRNHYLAAIERADSGAFGVAVVDVSTGELSACEAADVGAAIGELARLDPREVLVGSGAEAAARLFEGTGRRVAVRLVTDVIDEAAADAILDAQLGAGEAKASGASSLARRAAARCVAVAKASEAGRAVPITRLAHHSLSDVLSLDDASQAHLELARAADGGDRGALLTVIDATCTAAGARLLRRRLLAPVTRVAEIRRRQDAVELLVIQPGTRAELRERLREVGDIERLATKLALDRALPRDLVALRRSVAALPGIAGVLARCPDASAREAFGVGLGEPWLDVCEDVHGLLARAIADDPPLRVSDGGVVREGFDAALDESREWMRSGQRRIVELEAVLRESSGIAGLKLRYTRVFGWYMEVTKAHLAKVPEAWRRKQTVASGERFTCDDLDALADKLAHAEDRAASRETELFSSVVRALAAHADRLRAVAARVATWDVAACLAEVAHRDDWTRPVVDESLDLELEEARHPVVERLSAAGGRFVPNDVRLGAGDAGPRLWLITGPNMAGKSTLMRQTAIAVILAQMGAFVPARRARIGIVDRVLTRVGASDNLSRGESTFMVEMKETAHVLRQATRRSLVVIDEIGRGTSTYDGLAIAWAVAEHLHDAIACRSLFATHYHELTELAASRSPTCECWSVSAREHEGDVVFLHTLQRGAASRSYGIACARLAGVPEPVLARARTVLSELESGAGGAAAAPGVPRARSRVSRAQMALFESPPAAAQPSVEVQRAVDLLRAVDVDRLTPIDALQLVASLKKMTTRT